MKRTILLTATTALALAAGACAQNDKLPENINVTNAGRDLAGLVGNDHADLVIARFQIRARAVCAACAVDRGNQCRLS